MAIIVPALLENDFEELRTRLGKVLEIPDLQRVHVDFLNDSLTPGRTLPAVEIPVLDARIKWEAHLMITNPGDYFNELKRAGFSTVIIQYEDCAPEVLVRISADLRSIGLTPGLAIYPQTTISKALFSVLEHFEQITLLSVEPGKQGQKMEHSALDRIKALRHLIGAQKKIEVDGGINTENIIDAEAAGANLIVAGSAIFGNENSPLHNFLILQQALG